MDRYDDTPATHRPCPSAPDGGTHHLQPSRVRDRNGSRVMVCRTCHRTEQQILEES